MFYLSPCQEWELGDCTITEAGTLRGREKPTLDQILALFELAVLMLDADLPRM
jgi:hypothetical protein